MYEYQSKQPINKWADADRPREKLFDLGQETLSDAELLAILIGSGSRQESALDLSKRILNHNNNDLYQLGKMSISELMRFKGIGKAKAISIVAALDLGNRRINLGIPQRKSITSSNCAFHEFRKQLGDLNREEFWLLLLNNGKKVIKKQRLSLGGITGTIADTRLVFKTAIDHLATSIILVHNHPSGILRPSKTDIHLTQKLKDAGKLLDVQVLDHLIIAENQYFSFKDEALL